MRDALLIAAFVNAVLNALFAWLFTFSEDEIPLAEVPLVEGPSVLVDTVATCFVLPFLTTLADHHDDLEGDARRSPHADAARSPGRLPTGCRRPGCAGRHGSA